MTILKGLHVIEISGNGSAAMAAKHFADWGASVIILEPPAGSPLRDEPPYYEAGGLRRSATWQWLSRGKTAVRVAPGASLTPAGALRLCERADVVLAESEMTGPVLGLRPAEVRPALGGKTTCVLIAPSSTDGPYADYLATDLGINALGGGMTVLGDPAREPLRPGQGLMPRLTGVFALASALIGLRHVRRGGLPQFIGLSSQASAASMIVPAWLVKTMAGIAHSRRGNTWPMGVSECKDGWVGCPPLTPTHWEMVCHLMGIADVLDLPEGRDISWRMEHERDLYERVRPWLMSRTRREIQEQAQAYRLPAAPVQTIAGRLECPQLEARGFWTPAEIDGKTVKTPRVTCSVRGVTPVERAPLREVESADLPERAPAAVGGTPGLPFAGLRVLDLTAFWSGPYAMSLLAALGADVIKIESIQRPDPYRYTWAPFGKDHWYEFGPLWVDANCGKRDVALDLGSPQGKQAFERMAAKADIVVSNFANRVMPNLGLTNDRLLEINPRLIAVTMPGYGPGGPWEDYVGYAVAFEQLICSSMVGYADGPPSYAGGFCDPLVGMHTVAAIELALRYREETGRGTSVEVPQCEILDSIYAPEQIAVQHGAPVPMRRGNQHAWMAPHNAYQVTGDDRWVTIAVGSDAEFAALAETVGRPELASDPRFATIEARKQNEAALDTAVSDAVRELDQEQLEYGLQAAGVAACRVNKGFELPDDEGLRHIGFFQYLERKVTGSHPQKTWPFRFSGIDASHKRAAPLLGEHNAEVLAELAGLSSVDVDRLRGQRVIGNAPAGMVP